jgi:hypothetical protein
MQIGVAIRIVRYLNIEPGFHAFRAAENERREQRVVVPCSLRRDLIVGS